MCYSLFETSTADSDVSTLSVNCVISNVEQKKNPFLLITVAFLHPPPKTPICLIILSDVALYENMSGAARRRSCGQEEKGPDRDGGISPLTNKRGRKRHSKVLTRLDINYFLIVKEYIH